MKQRPLSHWLSSNEVLVYLTLFFGLCIFLPLFFWPSLYNEYFGAKNYLFWALAIIVTGVAWWNRRMIALPAGRWYLVYMAVLLGAGVFSALRGGDIMTSIWGVFGRGEYSLWTTLLVCALVSGLWTILVKVRQEEPQRGSALVSSVMEVFVITLVVLLFVFALIEYGYFPGRNGYNEGGVIRLTLGYSNPLFLSYLLTPLVGFLFVKTLLSKSNKMFMLRAVPLVMSILLLLWTYTRAAWIVAVVAVVLAVLLVLLLQRTRQLLLYGGLILMGTIVLVALHWGGIKARNADFIDKGSDRILEDLSQITGKTITDIREFYPDQEAVQNLTSSDIRLLELRWGWQMYTKDWGTMLWGYGPEREYYQLPKGRPALLNYIPTDANTKPYYIRNWYLHLLLTGGAVGLLLVVVPQLILGWSTLRWLFAHRKKDSLDTVVASTVVALATAVAAYVGYGAFYTAEISSFVQLIIFSVLLAWLIRGGADYKKEPAINLAGAWRWVVPVLVVLALLPTLRISLFDYYFAQSVNRQATTVQALDKALQARSWWPNNTGGDRAIASLSTQLFEQLLTTYSTISPVPNPPAVSSVEAVNQLQSGRLNHHQAATVIHEEILTSLEVLSKSANPDQDNLRILASTYYKLVRLDRDTDSGFSTDRYFMQLARQYGYKAIAEDPSLPVPYDNQALHELYIHNLAEAERLLLKSIELKSDYWFSYLHLGELYRQRCQPTKAMEFYEKAKPYVPLAEGELAEAGVEQRKLETEKKCQYTVWTKKDLDSIKVGQKTETLFKRLGEPHLWINPTTAEYYASTGECAQLTIENGSVTQLGQCQVVSAL